MLATVCELGVSFVAYSPLGRGELAGAIRSPDDFEPDDYRRTDRLLENSAALETRLDAE